MSPASTPNTPSARSSHLRPPVPHMPATMATTPSTTTNAPKKTISTKSVRPGQKCQAGPEECSQSEEHGDYPPQEQCPPVCGQSGQYGLRLRITHLHSLLFDPAATAVPVLCCDGKLPSDQRHLGLFLLLGCAELPFGDEGSARTASSQRLDH